MRIATSTLFNISTSGLQKHLSDQARLQEQLSTGRKILTPSDDPISSARILDISQTASINEQYATNSQTADSALSITEANLAQIVGVIQDMQTLAVNAGNATLSAEEKKMLDSELQGRYQELLGLANSTDGSGIYLFSGFQGGLKPFTETTFGKVQYNGDEGVRKIQISSGRQIPISENGNEVFRNIKSGNGTFVTAVGGNPGATPTTSNLGSGVISSGEVVSTSEWNAAASGSREFSIKFTSGTTYEVYQSGNTTPIQSGTYSAGGTIALSNNGVSLGVQFSISGTPSAGDTFTLEPSTNQDIFSTIGAFSEALNSYSTDSAGTGQAAFQNQLNGVMENLDNALSQVLKVQASIGARMKETESVQDTNEDLQLQYAKTISGLQDLDYAAAISEFSMNQMLLEATRSSFAKVQDLSLFKYI